MTNLLCIKQKTQKFWPKKGYPNFCFEEFHPFVLAILAKNYSMCQDMIDDGADVNCYYIFAQISSPHSFTYSPPLTLGLIMKSPLMLSFLLKNGANPNLRFWDQLFTPLTYAVSQKMTSCVKVLLEYGADPNCMGLYDVPLTIATRLGYLNIMALLLEAGANINGTEYSRPIVMALRRRANDSLLFLLERGVVLNLPKYQKDKCIYRKYKWADCIVNCDSNQYMGAFVRHRVGYTDKCRNPFQLAIRYRNIDLIKLLVTHGARAEFTFEKYQYSLNPENHKFLKLLRAVGCDFGISLSLYGRIDYTVFDEPLSLKECCRRSFYLSMHNKNVRKELAKRNISVPLKKYLLFEAEF